jgi:hypothetical protein
MHFVAAAIEEKLGRKRGSKKRTPETARAFRCSDARAPLATCSR